MGSDFLPKKDFGKAARDPKRKPQPTDGLNKSKQSKILVTGVSPFGDGEVLLDVDGVVVANSLNEINLGILNGDGKTLSQDDWVHQFGNHVEFPFEIIGVDLFEKEIDYKLINSGQIKINNNQETNTVFSGLVTLRIKDNKMKPKLTISKMSVAMEVQDGE
jgi:hypothetical protein